LRPKEFEWFSLKSQANFLNCIQVALSLLCGGIQTVGQKVNDTQVSAFAMFIVNALGGELNMIKDFQV
jgi:hypothetical protein